MFDCIKCQQNPELKQILGCNPTGVDVPTYKIGKYTLNKCPKAVMNEIETPLSDMFLHWRMWLNGSLPNSGTYLDQPAKFVEAMVLLDTLWVEYKTEQEQKQKEELNRLQHKYSLK